MWRSLAMLVLLLSNPVFADSVVAYNSYLFPPFLNHDHQSGLAPDLVSYLNRRLPAAYQLRLENVPRARLSKLVLNRQREKFAGVVLFLNPVFAGDLDKSRYLWSRPLTSDRNLLIFRAPLPWPIRNLDSLAGLHFSGVYEHRYSGIDERVKAGLLWREDAANELVNLAKVRAKRVDFTQTSESNFLALTKLNDFDNELTTVTVPGQQPFNRQILVGRSNTPLLAELDKVIVQMWADPEWQRIVSRYDLLPPQ